MNHGPFMYASLLRIFTFFRSDFSAHLDKELHVQPEECCVFSCSHRRGTKLLYDTPFDCSRETHVQIYGSEIDGVTQVPEGFLDAAQCVYLPMGPSIRSYNLSNTVRIRFPSLPISHLSIAQAAVGMFEYFRQVHEFDRSQN